MQKFALPTVTLLSVDCVDPSRTIKAMNKCMEGIDFGDTILLTNNDASPADEKIRTEQIEKIGSLEAYSEFMFRNLGDHFNTEHCLVIQYDGFVLNPGRWTDEFLEYDYIGAPWWYGDDCNVGNGGFSLRSLKLCQRLKSIYTPRTHPEDEVICRDLGRILKIEGFKFAPESLASIFSFEPNARHSVFRNDTFGFHWKNPRLMALLDN